MIRLLKQIQGQSKCRKCESGYEPSAGKVACQPLTCRGTDIRLGNQCVSTVPVIVGVAAILCAVFAALAYRMLQKRIVSQAAFLKANHLWQQLHSLTDKSCVAKQIAGMQISSIIEDARHESMQLGISLDYVLNELEETARTAMSHQEWRHDGQFVMAFGGFLKKYGGCEDKPPTEWIEAMHVDPPQDPNFHQLTPVLGYGKSAPGYGKICPRDGKLHCSYVDAINEQRCSGTASHFLSWAWSYKLSLPVRALRHWAEKNPWERHFLLLNVFSKATLHI